MLRCTCIADYLLASHQTIYMTNFGSSPYHIVASNKTRRLQQVEGMACT